MMADNEVPPPFPSRGKGRGWGDERVVALRKETKPVVQAASGTMRFNNSQLFIPVMKTQFGPRWAVKNGQLQLSDGSTVPIDVCLVANPLDDGEMGWLDRERDRFAGEFALGDEHERVIRHAAFSPVSFDLTVEVSADAGGEIVMLKLGIERTP